jgi:serine/threonine-protein kinase HipA
MPDSILVYADWEDLGEPKKLGELHIARTAASERFSFEYDKAALQTPLTSMMIDPRIQPYEGRQYPGQDGGAFGVFADASPDRWGRLLMKRRHERDVRAGVIARGSRLLESDFLLGVHDVFRVGGIRLKTTENGPFLDDQHDRAAPPLTLLRELEEAARRFENGEDISANGDKDWLRLLIAPGGSLGGARPKASVTDPEDQLWIAKFPSTRDEYDVGGWEMVVNTLANICGLQVAVGRAEKFASDHHCFLVKRFDRTPAGYRQHFASAMTMTEHTDGDDASTGASYLEIANVLIRHGSSPNEDLKELWKRIVFSMLVTNTDDHLRNHGFILEPGKGWRLSPAYDINPTPYADGLKLNVSENDNALDLELALSVAPLFRVKADEAIEILQSMKALVRDKWHAAARYLKLGNSELEMMAPAFRLAE